MQLNAKETTITKSLLKIVKFVDGDGIILEDIVSKKELILFIVSLVFLNLSIVLKFIRLIISALFLHVQIYNGN